MICKYWSSCVHLRKLEKTFEVDLDCKENREIT